MFQNEMFYLTELVNIHIYVFIYLLTAFYQQISIVNVNNIQHVYNTYRYCTTN